LKRTDYATIFQYLNKYLISVNPISVPTLLFDDALRSCLSIL